LENEENTYQNAQIILRGELSEVSIQEFYIVI
jgi:hypothetical protein